MDTDEYIEDSSIQYSVEESLDPEEEEEVEDEDEDEIEGEEDLDFEANDYRDIEPEKPYDEEYACNICKRNYKTPAVSVVNKLNTLLEKVVFWHSKVQIC